MAGLTQLGKIDISPVAIARVAAQALHRSYGVVGVRPRSRVDGLAQTLARDGNIGVQVRLKDGEITIDLYVIVEYGVRISAVARSLMKQVRFSVEQATGQSIGAVNVHVMGLRITHTD